MDKNKKIDLITLLQKLFTTKPIFYPTDILLLAVSGGQDSICLLFFFFHLQIQWNLSLQIVWCNHLWQYDSFSTMRELVKLAFIFKISLNSVITSQEISSEIEARNWRYNSLKRLLFFYNSKNLLTGHTGSDRIETILFNLIKGSGISGMHSLNWKKKSNLTQSFPPIFYNTFFLKKIFLINNKSSICSLKKKHPLQKKKISKLKKKKFYKIHETQTQFLFLKKKIYVANIYQQSHFDLNKKNNFPYLFKPRIWKKYSTKFFQI